MVDALVITVASAVGLFAALIAYFLTRPATKALLGGHIISESEAQTRFQE